MTTETGSLRVLVVEDDEDTATVEALLLGLEHHDVTIASNGPSALREIESETPDVVLLDIGLPGFDGHELARRIYDMRLPRRPLLIAVTGRSDPEARRSSRDAGIDMHLVKPVPPDALCMLLRRVRQVLH